MERDRRAHTGYVSETEASGHTDLDLERGNDREWLQDFFLSHWAVGGGALYGGGHQQGSSLGESPPGPRLMQLLHAPRGDSHLLLFPEEETGLRKVESLSPTTAPSAERGWSIVGFDPGCTLDGTVSASRPL